MGRQSAAGVDRWSWRAIASLLALAPWIVLRAAAEPFHLPKATFVLAVGVGLTGLLVVRAAEERQLRIARTPFLIPYITYLTAAVVVTASSEDPSISVWGEYRYFVGLWLILAVSAVVAWILRDPGIARYRTLAAATTVGAVPVTLYALVQLAGADPFVWTGDLAGVFSTMANPNFLAGFLAVVLPLSLTWAVMPGTAVRTRVAVGLMSLLLIVVVLATVSFQGPVAVAVGAALPLGLALRQRVPHRVFVAILTGVAALIAGVGAVLAGPLAAQIADGLRERTMMWETALAIFREAPLVGTGLGTYGIFFTPNRPPKHAELGSGFLNPEQAHNVALNHLAEGGLVLVVPWLATVLVVGYLLVRGLRREEGERQVLLAGFGGAWLAYHAQALVSIDLPVTVLLHWTSAAVIAGLAVTPGAEWSWTASRRAGSSSYGTAIRAVVASAALVLIWIVIVPLRADIAAASGFRAINAGDARSGIVRIESSTELAPYRATYWLVLASAQEHLGNESGALHALQEAASRDAGSSRQALAVGQFADRVGDLDLATLWYERALVRDPFNPAVLEAAADYYDGIGEFERAQALQSQADAILRAHRSP